MQSKNLTWVVLYAVAMAYVESAVVVYLRRLYGISDLITNLPPFELQIRAIELVRELATLVMLLTVGWAAWKKFQSRLGFAIFTFGLWDIFYYIWLWAFIGWPRSVLDTDLLFLNPLAWWGPVLAPVLIAALMIVGGALAVFGAERGHIIQLQLIEWAIFIVGNLVMLYTFMASSLAILPANSQTLSQLRPTNFHWLIYLVGLSLAAFSVLRAVMPVVKHTEMEA